MQMRNLYIEYPYEKKGLIQKTVLSVLLCSDKVSPPLSETIVTRNRKERLSVSYD